MFAKLKKTIEVQNNRPAHTKIQHTSASVLNQNNNSSASQASVHHSAKSHVLTKRSSQSKSPRTSTTEDFHEGSDTPVQQQTPNNEVTASHACDIGDRLSDPAKDLYVGNADVQAHESAGHLSRDLHLDADDLIRVLESSEFLEDFVSEAAEQVQEAACRSEPTTRTSSNSEDVDRLSEAENRIKTLEAELEEKSRRLEQHSRSGKHLSEHVEEIASLKRKLSDYETERRRLTIDFESKCCELSEVRQQLSTTRGELETTMDSLTQSRDELVTALKEVKLITLENESLASKVDTLTRANVELNEKLEASRKERESQVERCLASMSELQTMAEVAEVDRRELEIKILDMERKFEEELKVARLDSTNDVRKLLAEMEEQVREKNKLLKKQEHKLSELRKVVQKELSGGKQSHGNVNNNASEGINHALNDAEEAFFNNSSDVDAGSSVARINVTSAETSSYPSLRMSNLDLTQDLNFKYLKHVILKFFLSREHEALQLIKVVSMLLRFDKDEEKMIKDTLQWRTSWFRSKPQLPEKGQSAIVVPALY